MPKHIGHYIYTYDFKDSSKKNLSIGLVKKVIPDMSANFPEICPLVIVCNHGIIVQSGWAIVKGFLLKSTRDKFKFLKNQDQISAYYRDLVPSKNLPVRYGGEDDTFEAAAIPIEN